MWLAAVTLILGFVTLVWSADRFLNGAAATACELGMSPLLVGLTIVSLGTSAPEILVALAAASEGTPLLAIGNAIGSNITNIGLVLGFTALLVPLPFAHSVLREEMPWLLATTAAALLALVDLELGLLEGAFLLAMLAVLVLRLYRTHRRGNGGPHPELENLEEIPDLERGAALWWLCSGLLVLLGSAELIVWAASTVAKALGVSELVIGLTIIAVGTSLPELAATVGSALKGHTDIAIGNVVGSNILNILAVMSVPGLLAPVALGTEVLWRDFATMLGLTLLLALFAYGVAGRPLINRFEGLVLLSAWIGYNVLLYRGA
ncbi:MAG: calcium/sodium antiporter [Pseudomonadales bacterium]|jgi:cation:H+ antiporter|nr:calcium/sodium antiporter [Pseudomonadales bacterium]